MLCYRQVHGNIFNKQLTVELQLPWEAQIMRESNTESMKFKCSKGQGSLCLVWNSGIL